MRTVATIYEEYRLMPSLQLHQLRVGAVGKILAEHHLGIDERQVILTCLFHDMGNIIKSQLEVFPEFLEPQGIEYWQTVKDDFLGRYGADEHAATVVIAKELELPERIVAMIDTIGFSNIQHILKQDSREMQIAEYADMRVGPHGIIPMHERLQDLKYRYSPRWKQGNFTAMEESFDANVLRLQELEERLFAGASIRPEDITDAVAAPVIEELKKYEVS